MPSRRLRLSTTLPSRITQTGVWRRMCSTSSRSGSSAERSTASSRRCQSMPPPSKAKRASGRAVRRASVSAVRRARVSASWRLKREEPSGEAQPRIVTASMRVAGSACNRRSRSTSRSSASPFCSWAGSTAEEPAVNHTDAHNVSRRNSCAAPVVCATIASMPIKPYTTFMVR